MRVSAGACECVSERGRERERERARERARERERVSVSENEGESESGGERRVLRCRARSVPGSSPSGCEGVSVPPGASDGTTFLRIYA